MKRPALVAVFGFVTLASGCSDGGTGAAPESANAGSAGATAAGSAGATSSGGTQAGQGGSANAGETSISGAAGAAGTSAGGTTGSACAQGTTLASGGLEFECGASSQVFESSGRPDNRVNYVILGDGYVASELDGAYLDHIANVLEGDGGMFSELGEPYVRYRKFINICALKVASNESGVDGPGGDPARDTAFGGGNIGDRLGGVDEGLVQAAIAELMPDHVDVDWVAVSLNVDEWWNSGGQLMVWSGAHMQTDALATASVALHEGGHAFHGLADEYVDPNLSCAPDEEPPEVNVTADSSGSKWAHWLGFDHNPGSGLQGAFEGGRYCATGIWRPSQDSEMNILPQAFNMPSIEKIVRDIYEIVDPIDSHTDDSAPLTNPAKLELRLIDPAVLKVEWSVDGVVVTADGGECFDTALLGPGEHSVQARAYDDTPWVDPADRAALEQSVTWTLTIE